MLLPNPFDFDFVIHLYTVRYAKNALILRGTFI